MNTTSNNITISLETIAELLKSIKRTESEEVFKAHLVTFRSLLDNKQMLEVLNSINELN